MEIEIQSEEELDNYTICHRCHTLHRNKVLADGTKALCTECGAVLYQKNRALIKNGLALSISGLIFFALANLFPLIKVQLVSEEQSISVLSMLFGLIDGGYYIVGFFVGFLVFVFPLMVFMIYFVLFLALRLRKGRELSRDLLILLAFVLPWNMSDIFLISILVALVKLFGMLEVQMGVSFWNFIAFVALDLYMTRNIHIGELWELRDEVYRRKQQ